MSEKTGPTKVIELTPSRRVWLNTLDLASGGHYMYGLVEVDVTIPRQVIREHKDQTGETLSFTGFLTYCLAQSLDEFKSVQAYLKNRKQFIVFDEVSVALMIEHRVGNQGDLMGYILRQANHKSFLEIHQEIRSIQSSPAPKGKGMPQWYRTAMLLPRPFSKIFSALIRAAVQRNPEIMVEMTGTVGISSIGMFGSGHSGWGLYTPTQSFEMVVGSIAWKPAIVEGRVEAREILNLTLMFDHYVIDGAPAARFTQRLVELIEKGHGLDKGINYEKDNPAFVVRPGSRRGG